MPRSIYLINPAEGRPGYFGAEVLERVGNGPGVLIADLVLPTVAAMIPASWDIELIDERIRPVDLSHPAEIIGITGKVSQRDRMVELADHFRRLGKTVVVGGPYASLNAEDISRHCDVLVRGELETVAARLFSDLESGDWKSLYQGEKADLSLSPVPRWDLYDHASARVGVIQTSRGCPFDCEFCDVIQYVGRKQRHKSVEQILEEVEQLYRLGKRYVFLADDNFTVYRRRAREVLEALRDWRRRKQSKVGFSTQVSMDLARDEELMQLCVDAGLRIMFIGIETPSEASLKETGKRPNLRIDLARELRKFVEFGIYVTGGIIVGFDSDGPDIFAIQKSFMGSLPIPIFSIGALVAPSQTPLRRRLAAENRLAGHDRLGAAEAFRTNIIPLQMSREELTDGIRGLIEDIYEPNAFGERLVDFIHTCKTVSKNTWVWERPVTIGQEQKRLLEYIRGRQPGATSMLQRVFTALTRKPDDIRGMALDALFCYAQICYMLEKSQGG